MIITFDPIIYDKVWGTEEWLLTEENVPNNIPKSLWEDIQVEAWGRKNPDRSKFPLALKVIDAKENLSLQVHPDKNELWYVLEAKECSKLSVGAAAIWPKLDQEVEAKAGDSINLPQGTVHMLGAGVKVFELADCLGTTYRLFDHGRDRELQIEQGIQCIRPGFSKSDQPIPKRKDPFHLGLPYEVVWPLKLCIEDVPSLYPRYPSKSLQLNVPQEHSKEGFVNEYTTRLYVPNDSTFRYHYVLEGPIACEGQSFEKGQGFLVTASHRKGYVLNGTGSVLTVSFL